MQDSNRRILANQYDIRCISQQASQLDHPLEYLNSSGFKYVMANPQALKLCSQFLVLIPLKITKTYQRPQTHANFCSEEELPLDLPVPQNPIQHGQSSVCTLLSNLLYH